MWKNIVQPDRSQVKKYGAFALQAGYLRLPTHTQNMLLFALSRQQLHECASVLRYTYIVSKKIKACNQNTITFIVLDFSFSSFSSFSSPSSWPLQAGLMVNRMVMGKVYHVLS